MRKTVLFAAILSLFFGLAPYVLAAGTGQNGSACTSDNDCVSGLSCAENKCVSFVALAPIPGLTDASVTSVVNSTSLATFFNNLYKYLIGLAAILAIIQIIWSGLDIAYFHKDAVSTITDDKGKIYNAIYGLILVLSPAIVFSIINPNILNLSLNLPALDTKSSTSTRVPIAPTPPPLAGGLNSIVSTDPSLRLMFCTNDPDCKNTIKSCSAIPGRPQQPKCLSPDGKTAQVTSVDPKTNTLTCPGSLSLVVGCNVPTP
ncbi:MAG: hypothetical protein WC798_01525 [Candidatus Paceibacterota bacterium]|jgi:hypothetical protein